MADNKRTDAELMAAARHITKIEEVTLLCDRFGAISRRGYDRAWVARRTH